MAVVRRHLTARVWFNNSDGEPVQTIRPARPNLTAQNMLTLRDAFNTLSLYSMTGGGTFTIEAELVKA